MPVDDAVAFIARNFETYMRGEKTSAPSNIAIAPAPIAAERHPEAIQVNNSKKHNKNKDFT